MARTSTFHAYDRLLGGRLGAMLLEWRTSGESAEDIAYRLRSEHDIKVSSATALRWLAIAEAELAEAAS
jgi:hypothetical protein